LANTDESNESGWDQAFQAGVEKLGKDSKAYPFAREAQVYLNEFDASLDRLAEASPAIKRSLLHACAALVLHDGTVNDLQFELLRAIAETLDCPIPPSVPCP
jgi:flagellar biosynthesis/type III secretory pathway protein FliH